MQQALDAIEDLKNFVSGSTNREVSITISGVYDSDGVDTLVNISEPNAYPPITLQGVDGGELRQSGADGTVVLVVAGGTQGTLGVGLNVSGGVDTSKVDSRSGGVVVLGNGTSSTKTTFTVNGDGAEITGNFGYRGGGVYVGDGATFVLQKGKIDDNEGFFGGGVYVGSGATFKIGEQAGAGTSTTRSVGLVSENNAILGGASGNIDAKGGGVYVNGTFRMNDGGIVRNTTTGQGGGVYVNTTGTFAKTEYASFPNSQQDGGVRGNVADDGGTQVYDEKKTPKARDSVISWGDLYN
jgi:hypothetical protein